jgi:hypothetical protein
VSRRCSSSLLARFAHRTVSIIIFINVGDSAWFSAFESRPRSSRGARVTRRERFGAMGDMDDSYLSDLLSYSVERLNREPELLDADGERAARRKQEVALQQYRAFVGASECYDTVRSEVADIERGLEAMRGALPELRAGCQAFAARAEEISRARARNRQTLAHQAQLLDILEVPSLQDTCVRHGNYDEALDLESFVSKMVAAHADDVPVVRALGADARASSDVMLAQLLGKLRGAIQLPECLRVVGYLRRMRAFDETGLRRAFLACRERFIADRVEELDDTDPHDYLRRLADAHRVHCFDVVMQYRSIFADERSQADAADTHNPDAATGTNAPSFSSSSFSSTSSSTSADGGLLYSWSAHRVSTYLRAIESTLPRVREGGALASALEHARYTGASLARVGLDFRPLLEPMFADAARNIFDRAMDAAVSDFERVAEQHRWAAMPSAAAAAAAAAARPGAAGDAAESPEDPSNASANAPPYALLEHVPVAAFVNGALSAFNELRHCAASASAAAAARKTRDAIERAANALARLDRRGAVSEGDGRRAAFEGACEALMDVAAPYLAACLGRIFKGGEKLVDARAAAEPLRRQLIASKRANQTTRE